jgi:hypothetical protein
MLEWAIKEIVKEEAEEEKLRKEEEARLNPVPEATHSGFMAGKGMSNLMYLILLIPLALIALNYFVL